jgi:hypothetical protein
VTDLGPILGQFIGKETPGGCDDCDAYQTVDRDPEEPLIWNMRVHHDDWCPTLARHRRRSAR